MLEALLQQFQKFRFRHLSQVVRIVPISRRELWVRRGNDKLAPRCQHVCDAANGIQLHRMVDMFDHLETGHQIK